MLRSKRLAAIAAVILVGLGVLWLSARIARRPAPEAPADLLPEGRWHRISELQRQAEQQRAQLLSLGYLSGRFVAPDGSGIVSYEPERAWPGINLYTSGDAPTVRLMTLEGELLHTWSSPYRRAFPNGFETHETDYIRRARLLESGDLIVLYQGGGIARLDADSNVVWASAEPAFNDLDIGPDGVLRVIGKRPVAIDEIDGLEWEPAREVLEDSIVELSIEDGRVLGRVSILRALAASRYRSVLDPLPTGPDILHGNTVSVLTDASHEPFATGQLLVSLREIDTLAVIDPRDGRAVWAARGPWQRQHEPILLPGRRLLLFDNRGGEDGTSRVIELDLESDETVWEYGDVDSPQAGVCRRLPNGNTLITESERGRAVEVTPAGEIVWEFVSPHRAGRNGELVATLFELERYTVSDDWLEKLLSGGPFA
ncbi:MAG TPA: arylsulfotransferase family protein [Thermoanaerobaculia bacterium]|nr:arylsulfotransferase family protein [Thermoanaerobaculia bacterium]